MKQRRFLLIVNPCAGRKRGARELPKIQAELERGGLCTVYETRARGDATAYVAAHAAEADVVVCVGGDGTFNEVAAGLRQAGIERPIGYIPAGSTNDFAAGLQLSLHPATAARQVVEGSPVNMDIGLFGDRPFTYIASCGVFTRASYATAQEAKNAVGHLAYVIEGLKELPELQKPLHLRIETPEETLEGEYLYASFSNSLSCGGVLKFDPKRVDMNDGKLEMLLIKAPTKPGELSRAALALTNRVYTDPLLHFVSVPRATVITPPDTPWTLDGEFDAGAERVEIRAVQDALQVLR